MPVRFAVRGESRCYLGPSFCIPARALGAPMNSRIGCTNEQYYPRTTGYWLRTNVHGKCMERQAFRGGDVAARIRDVSVGHRDAVFPRSVWAVADRSEIRHRVTQHVARSRNVSNATLQNSNLRDMMHQSTTKSHPVLLFLSRSFLLSVHSCKPCKPLDGGC